MAASHPELHRLRDSIDNIDAALVHLLAERFKCTQAVGRYKAEHGLPPADPSREGQQIARLRSLAENARLAEQEWGLSARTAGLYRPSASPIVTLRPSAGSIDIQLRYVTRAAGRFEVRDRLYRRVISLFQEKNHAPQPPAPTSA